MFKLLKRLVVAVEKIADNKLATPTETASAMITALQIQFELEEQKKIKSQKNNYEWLKTKKSNNLPLTDDEKNWMLWAEHEFNPSK